MKNDKDYMALAIAAADEGRFTAHPNPRVGCVLVKGGAVVGTGFHLQTGHGHAEANALAVAGDAARGATAYVTLEPCSFAGRTPSCAKALVEAGVSRVVAALADPHPRNGGAGFDLLRDAGVDVEVGPLAAAAHALNPGHFRRFAGGLPYVRCKLAMTLDGKTALANGASQWITSPAARRDVQRLRAMSGAIVTGVQTVIDDDPQLTVRADEIDVTHAALAAQVPRLRAVLDSNLRMPRTAKMATADVLAYCTEDAARGEGGDLACQVVGVPGQPHRLDLAAVLRDLAQRDCNEVLFECGATLAGSLLAAGLADELIVYTAPKLMGDGARSLLKLPEVDTMGDLIELEFTDVQRIGPDLRLTATPLKKPLTKPLAGKSLAGKRVGPDQTS
jgi:diaminohydroxyphosphoribosylaminopyrimidine deaminase/5-amino-6-(5-phosphoribosylamino)uracil reductase